jgi:hypothetical protein
MPEMNVLQPLNRNERSAAVLQLQIGQSSSRRFLPSISGSIWPDIPIRSRNSLNLGSGRAFVKPSVAI